MQTFLTLEEIQQVAEHIRPQLANQPQIGIILGSGLGALADTVENSVSIPYQDIPGWAVSTVVGHSGRLVSGTLEGKPVLVMQGRVHYYEGYPIDRVTMPVRVMKQLGIETLIVTNAAGAVHPDFIPGDLMLITDHLNLLGMAGVTPLRGPNLETLGPRFPDMSQAYDRELLGVARRVASQLNLTLREGVYVCLAGPSFETPADLRFLRAVGVDAVGMSTVPEVTVARHQGQRVLGISGISNKANLDGNTITTHEEVIEAGAVMSPKLIALIRGILQAL
ncbi:MAG: purine-nucleoside phosphorylase [Anaerolineales bacterium]